MGSERTDCQSKDGEYPEKGVRNEGQHSGIKNYWNRQNICLTLAQIFFNSFFYKFN